MKAGAVLILLVGILSGFPSTVFAESDVQTEQSSTQLDESARREQARTLFERGVSLYRDERYREALNYFVGAQNLFPNTTITFNIARTCERLQDVPCALGKYREYRRAAQNANDLDEVMEHIRALELALSKKGVQQVTLFSEPGAASVVVDGAQKGTTPWTGELRPGQHKAHLKHPGFMDLEISFLVEAAHAADWTYRLQSAPVLASTNLEQQPHAAQSPASRKPAAPANTPPPTTARRGGPEVGSWTWVALGSGVAALGVAGVLEGLRASSEHDVRSQASQLERVAAFERMQDYQKAARISAGAGVVFSALGLTLLTLDVTRDHQRKTISAECTNAECRLDVRGVW